MRCVASRVSRLARFFFLVILASRRDVSVFDSVRLLVHAPEEIQRTKSTVTLCNTRCEAIFVGTLARFLDNLKVG